MASSSATRATLDDLYQVEGKAELIDGRIVHYMATGHYPSVVSGEIFVSLRQHARKVENATAYPDGISFAVDELSSGRESFSPDASWYEGPLPANPMRFVEGPPKFAAEVRSENDYGDMAETEMAAKRADYFEAGTQVVWDVDPKAKVVHVYRSDKPNVPTTRRLGDTADAEPAVPGWTMEVNDIFGEE